MTRVGFTLQSKNGKTGPIPVSTSEESTCPDACQLKGKACYAKHGHVGMHWRNVSSTAERDAQGARIKRLLWSELVTAVAALPDEQLWRHNQAGDLPGEGDAIDADELVALVEANMGKKGFTYTHKPPHHGDNARLIADANACGFTINLSANNLAHADELAALGIGPVAVVLPADVQGNVRIETPAGKRVVVCPATYRDDVSCASCGLCAVRDRKVVVGFPAHGAGKRSATEIAMG